jgi:hypothetical protein
VYCLPLRGYQKEKKKKKQNKNSNANGEDNPNGKVTKFQRMRMDMF